MKGCNGKNNKKGYALAVTLVIMVALFILGIAIMAMSSTEAVHTALQYNNTQAYYSARSGIEIGLVKLQKSLDTNMFDTVQDLYNSVSTGGAFSGEITAGRDTYTVQFLDGGLVSQDQMKIYSVGAQANMQATTALTLFFNSPNYMPLNWLNPGNIIKKGYWEMTTDALVVRTVKTTGHSVKKSTNVDTTWNARSIHFVDSDSSTGFCLEVTAKKIEFQTNLLSFKYPVFFDKNVDEDTVTLNPRKDKDTGIYEGFKNADGSQPNLTPSTKIKVGWGVLVLKQDFVSGNNTNVFTTIHGQSNPGLVESRFTFYAFAPGTQLCKTADWTNTAKMELITDANTKKYILDTIDADTMLQFDADSAIWSKN